MFKLLFQVLLHEFWPIKIFIFIRVLSKMTVIVPFILGRVGEIAKSYC
jgi:hypothetical protein